MLVENLLDVSRLSTARFTLELEWVDLAELAREVVERLGEQGARTGSRFRVRARGPVVGQWDRLRLEQVLVNLLSNALKFSRGNPIEIGVSAEEGVARLSIRDRGVGIAAADLSRIFERGVANREHGGLGLGLYITRCIVERHGGSISATSQVGVGSTFSVELPLQRRLEDAPAAEES
jgi:signal transduction histidine kinase